MIEVMRRFWNGGVAEFHGEFYDFGPTSMFPAPDRSDPDLGRRQERCGAAASRPQ